MMFELWLTLCTWMIDNVITILKLQQPMEKRFFVNYVQKNTKN